MTRKLLLSGIVLILFYEVIVWVLMPSGRIPEWINFRVTKEYIAVGLALFLTALIWLETGKLSCPNMWALFFLIFLFFNLSKSPIIGAGNDSVEVGVLGNFTAEFKVFSFFLMFCSIASARFDDKFIEEIILTIFLSGVVMSVYMILQAMNLDQIFKPKPEYFNTDVKALRVAGTFGQPTLAVPFLAMCIPLAVYSRSALGLIALMVLPTAMLLTGSDFAFASLLLLTLLYSFRSKIFSYILTFTLLVIPALLFFKPLQFFNDNGRFNAWWLILGDVFSGEINGLPVRFGLFGAGLNNFALFRSFHETVFMHAHNEYLQVLWCGGVIGLALFLMIHIDIIQKAVDWISEKRIKAIFFSLLVVMLCSFGTFVMQLGAYQFLIVLMAGLIYQIANNQEAKHAGR